MGGNVALIILNFNHAKDTLDLIDSLAFKLDKRFYYFIIDNNSKDVNELEKYAKRNRILLIDEANCQRPVEVFKSAGILLKLSYNYGYAKGNNFGLKVAFQAGFKYAFVINPDVEICNINVFSSIIDILERNTNINAIVAPRIILPNGINQGPYNRNDIVRALSKFLFPFSFIINHLKKSVEVLFFGYNHVYCVVGCFFGLNLQIFSKIGYFDENTFLYFEEYIICEKLRRANKKVIYIPTVKVIHKHINEGSILLNPVFIESRNYYENNYLKISNLNKLILKLSSRYYELTWKKLKK